MAAKGGHSGRADPLEEPVHDSLSPRVQRSLTAPFLRCNTAMHSNSRRPVTLGRGLFAASLLLLAALARCDDGDDKGAWKPFRCACGQQCWDSPALVPPRGLPRHRCRPAACHAGAPQLATAPNCGSRCLLRPHRAWQWAAGSLPSVNRRRCRLRSTVMLLPCRRCMLP